MQQGGLVRHRSSGRRGRTLYSRPGLAEATSRDLRVKATRRRSARATTQAERGRRPLSRPGHSRPSGATVVPRPSTRGAVVGVGRSASSKESGSAASRTRRTQVRASSGRTYRARHARSACGRNSAIASTCAGVAGVVAGAAVVAGAWATARPDKASQARQASAAPARFDCAGIPALSRGEVRLSRAGIRRRGHNPSTTVASNLTSIHPPEANLDGVDVPRRRLGAKVTVSTPSPSSSDKTEPACPEPAISPPQHRAGSRQGSPTGLEAAVGTATAGSASARPPGLRAPHEP